MKRFNNILCVVKPGVAYKPALEHAVTLAEHNHATLTLIDVVERFPANIPMLEGGPTPAELHAAMTNTHQQQLESMAGPYRKRVEIQTKILKGVPFLEIIREVLRNERDLVIKAPVTPEWLDRLFASDDMHLLRKCPCPVWLVKPEAPPSYRRILAAVDADDAYPAEELDTRKALNKHILEMASSLALAQCAELHVVHAWEAVGERALRTAISTPEEDIIAYVDQVRWQHQTSLETLLREVTGKLENSSAGSFKPLTHLVKGWARKEIPALAKRIKADLIVMGTVARTGIPGFIVGNTAETILNQIDCSVLAIKPPGFVTPVTLLD